MVINKKQYYNRQHKKATDKVEAWFEAIILLEKVCPQQLKIELNPKVRDGCKHCYCFTNVFMDKVFVITYKARAANHYIDIIIKGEDIRISTIDKDPNEFFEEVLKTCNIEMCNPNINY